METYGILGYPLTHTLSPQLHSIIYREMGVQAIYNRFELPPERVSGLVQALKLLGVRGINVTMPYKQAVISQMDKLSPEAEKLQAVNTIDLRPDGTVWGHNTDYYGFLMQLERFQVPIQNRRFVLCGMSGAARAIRQALLDNGAAEVLVASTDPEKGIPYASLRTIESFDTIVNCTPVGMFPKVDETIVGEDILLRFHWAVDIVYNPMETLFLKKAKKLGLVPVGGLYMLVYQGIKSYEIWTGRTVGQEIGDIIYSELNQNFL